MKHKLFFSLLLLVFPAFAFTQGVSCPAVVAGPDTTLNCNDCVLLHAQPVSGFAPTTYTVQSIPYSPYPYAGTSILVNIDDIWSAVLPIGFNFCFYGNTYNQCVVGSNGVVSFDLSYAGGYCEWVIAQGIPGNPDVLNSVLGPYHDIDPSVGGNIYWAQYGTAPCRVFVVSFVNVPMFSCNNLIATQQIVLYETTNIVEVYIQNKPTCSSWNSGAAIEGIQNAAGTQAVVVPGRNYPGTWNAANDAYAFVPAGAPNYTITWYEVGNVIPLTTLDTITVCPTGPTDYYAEVVYTNCNGSTVTVRDTASIVASSSSMVLTTTQTDASCNGAANGTANLTVTGNSNPFTILWSNGQTTANLTGLTGGTYTVTVTEQGGCAAVTSVTIHQPPAIVLQTQSTNPLCNGQATGTASVNASGGAGGFSYLWSNGSTSSSLSGLVAGNYAVTVTDANACTATAAIAITQPQPLVLNLSSTDVVCFGNGNGTATAAVNGGTAPYQYAWNTGATSSNLTNLGPGNYSVTVTDANGCSASGSTTVIEPAAVTLQVTSTNVSCNGVPNGTATATASGGTGGLSYLWSNGQTQPSLSGLAAGNYSVTVTDANGCSATGSVVLTQPPLLMIQLQQANVPCNGQNTGVASVTASGGSPGYTYLWSNGETQNIINGVAAGAYSVTVTDANGCQAIGNITITEPSPLVVAVSATPVTCFAGSDGTASATVSGGVSPYQYQWSNGAQVAHLAGLTTGTYAVTVIDANGCTSAASATVDEPTQILMEIMGDAAICEYDSVRLSAVITGGVPAYDYQWWSVPTAVNDTDATLVYDGHDDRTYHLRIVDQNGCEATASYYVESHPAPVAGFLPDRVELCDSGTVDFENLSSPSDVSSFWEFSDGQSSTQAAPAHWFGAGNWSTTLTVTTVEGCVNSFTREFFIRIIPTPEAAFVSDPNISLIDHLLLSQATVSFNNTSSWFTSGVAWSFGTGDSSTAGAVTYTFPDTGRYCVTMTAYNVYGCHTDTTQCITILDDPYLWVPTGFTPNGDGLNDIFLIGGIEIVEFDISIFDRWGRLIFSSNSMDKGWDGRAMNEDAPEGAYAFKINAVNNQGKKIARAGTVTLIR